MKNPTVLSIATLAILVGVVSVLIRFESKTTQSDPGSKASSELGGPSVPRAEARSPQLPERAARMRQMRSPSQVASAPLPILADLPMTNEEEDELLAMSDTSSRQREWRAAYAAERKDPQWTVRMEQELRRQATDILDDRKMIVRDLSCRETICRMYLQFDDQLDAEAFKNAKRDPSFKYELLGLDPEFKGEGFDRTNHTYEFMVQRPRPDDPNFESMLEPKEEVGVVHAGKGEGEQAIVVSQ